MRTASVPGWSTSPLWKALEKRGDEPAAKVKHCIESVLPKAEDVLTNGDSGPGSFTLHDAAHSWRVSKRMAELAGAGLVKNLEPYDLGMLLLAAYLHDIGMTPPVARVDRLLAHVLSGETANLPEDELEALQAWLDDNAQAVQVPMSEGPPSAAVLQEARSLVARYVRARHNDWSAVWISENLNGIDEDTYEGFQSDLIRLCQSHHQGYEKLRTDEFEPRLVGSPATVLHLRFDACLLRVADVLDFDPERTPKILYSHRDVEATSAIFWHKDHDLAFAQKDNRLLIHARPGDALTHHAIELTVRDVDRELQLCRRLAEEAPFDRMGDDILPHTWRMETNVRATIKPRDNAYEYIDGTFRPDQERILELLGGLSLYGSSFAAARELLQNAFDAVREQIAYQRLRHKEPAAASTLEQIAGGHRVDLILDATDEGVRLICRDTGVGMSREVIRSRFLVGGSAPSHETRVLERQCAEEGFSVNRTARFGIGVLAYFLLGSQLQIQTRRSIEAGGDQEEVGWTFSSDGLSDFGELKRNPGCQAGTQVELLIRHDAMPDGQEEFAAELDRYIRSTVRCVPCHFSFVARGFDLEPFVCEPGWVDRREEAEACMLSPMYEHERQVAKTETETYSSEMRRTHEREYEGWTKLREDAAKALCIESEEGDLPDDLGTYRIWLGHFQHGDEPLLTYLSFAESDGDALSVLPILFGLAIDQGSESQMSWNGMAIEPHRENVFVLTHPRLHHPGLFFEVDFTNDAAGELAVDRATVGLSDQAKEALTFVLQRAISLQGRLVRKHEGSPFSFFNAQIAGVTPKRPEAALWPISEGLSAKGKPIKLSPIAFPAIDVNPILDSEELHWRGKPVSTVKSMRSSAAHSRTWHGNLFPPQHLGVQWVKGRLHPVPVWSKAEGREPVAGGFTAEFPPEWAELVGFSSGESSQEILLWNYSHPIIEAVDATTWEWALTTFEDSNDPVPHEGDLLQSPSRIAAWILLCLHSGMRVAVSDSAIVWNGLEERAPSFLREAWRMIGLSDDQRLVQWRNEPYSPMMVVASSISWEAKHESITSDGLVGVLSEPGVEWWLNQPRASAAS